MKKDTLLEKIKDLSDLDKHQEIIDMIEGLPTEQLNNEIIGQLARAYINVQNYEKAIEVLKSIEKDEKNNKKKQVKKAYLFPNSISCGSATNNFNILILRSKKVDLLLVPVRLILSHQPPLVVNVCYFIS